MHLPAASQFRGSGSTTKCPLIPPGETLPEQDAAFVSASCVCVCVLLLNEHTDNCTCASSSSVPLAWTGGSGAALGGNQDWSAKTLLMLRCVHMDRVSHSGFQFSSLGVTRTCWDRWTGIQTSPGQLWTHQSLLVLQTSPGQLWTHQSLLVLPDSWLLPHESC